MYKTDKDLLYQFSSVQSLSRVQFFVTPWTAACQASLSVTISWSLLNSCPLSQWCHPTISSSAAPFSSCPQFFPASGSFPMSWLLISGGQSTGASASASVLPGLISFRIDWFHLLAAQGTLKSLLRHHSWKASLLRHSAFFMVQLFTSIHDYRKNHSFDCTELGQQNDVSAF